MMNDTHFDGDWLYALCGRLYPIARSLTGAGVRQTLDLLAAALAERAPHAPPLVTHSIASGTAVFDWEVPQEWTPRAAWIKGPDGRRRADFAEHSLHLVGYSAPIHETMPLSRLRPHLHSLPDRPAWIPYRTSYYQRTWGFCLADDELRALPDGDYEVFVDADLAPGVLNWGEVFLPGESEREILVWTHVCHPSLANDNLSGLTVALALAAALAGRPRRLGVRFVFAPGTIGAISWLAASERTRARIEHALVLSNLGDAGPFHYKLSRDGDCVLDAVFRHLFEDTAGWPGAAIEPFTPYGYDERQFNSPGINIPAGCLTRTPHGRYPQYHTSGDDLSFISADALGGACRLLAQALHILEHDRRYLNLAPFGEPQLGRRGLYDTLGGENERRMRQLALLWVLNQSDGDRSLLSIARRAGMPFATIHEAAQALAGAGLLREAGPRAEPPSP